VTLQNHPGQVDTLFEEKKYGPIKGIGKITLGGESVSRTTKTEIKYAFPIPDAPVRQQRSCRAAKAQDYGAF